MKQYLVVFAACLSAIVVGLLGYEWYRGEQEKQDQAYRTTAYLSRGMVVSAPLKVALDNIWQSDGTVPCTTAEFEAAGIPLPRSAPDKALPGVEVTGCGAFALNFAAFDGTPAGWVVLQANPDADAIGSYFSWKCSSPSYENIQDVFPECSYAPGAEVAIQQPPAANSALAVSDGDAGANESCGLDAVIYRSVFTDDVIDRTPQNRVVAIGPKSDVVFFFTEVIGAGGRQVSHEWFHNGVPVSTVPFDVQADRWRTWSSKRLAGLGPGTLHVEVRDGHCLIGQESIELLAEDPVGPRLSGPMSPYQAVEAALALTRNGDGRFTSVLAMTPVGELIRFDDGDTPLHRAIRTGNERAVRALLADAEQDHEHDIPRGLQILFDYDAGGRQSLDIARDSNQGRIVELLQPLVARASPEWAVSHATFTTGMSDGEPVDCRMEAYDDEQSLTFFAELTDMGDRQVRHEWVFDSRVVQANEFHIGSDRWTTQSTRRFSPADTGQWQVRVTAASGDVLHVENLRYDVLNDLNERRRESYRNFPCDYGGATLLPYATAYAPIARFEYLLQKGARLDNRRERLMWAVIEGRNVSLLRWLLGKGFAIDGYIGEGHTALTLAAESGDANLILFLLRQGAEIDRKNRRARMSPLGFATLRNKSLVTRILLEHGAKPNDTNPDSVSALARAVRACNLESTRLLLEYGADPEIADNRGERPAGPAEQCVKEGAWPAEAMQLFPPPAASALPD